MRMGTSTGTGIGISQTQVVAQGRALVLRTKHSALPERRELRVDEDVEAAGGVVRDEDDEVGPVLGGERFPGPGHRFAPGGGVPADGVERHGEMRLR